MNNKNNAESLVWIVIWIFILSFILIWMINVIWFSKDISFNYENKIEENLIKYNSENIISKLDTSDLQLEEEFYIQKDSTAKKFRILTWAINKNFSYIDKLWNNTSSGSEWKVFERKYFNKIDILRHVIYPPEIDNFVFHFDANNVNWANNSWINNWDNISTWKDLSSNHINAQSSSWDEAIFITGAINKKPALKFNNSLFQLPYDSSNNDNNEKHVLINNDNDIYANRTYKEKSFAIVLKTWLDVTTDQTIYEQWWQATWYNFMIHNWNIYAWIHNKADSSYSNTDYSSTDSTFYYTWDSWNKFKSINLWEALPETVYFIQIIQDSTHLIDNWTPHPDNIDTQNKLQIYLNWNLVMEQNHVDPMPEHWKAWIWAVNEYSVEPWSPFNTINNTKWKFFKWEIWEFISWNHALSVEEVRWVQNYFVNKWLGWVESVRHNIIETDVSLIK